MKTTLILSIAWVVGGAAACKAEVDQELWEQSAFGADFVGVVECTTAGGPVAEFRVLESWKPGPAAETLRLLNCSYYWELHYPAMLVGERYLFMTRRTDPIPAVLRGNVYGKVPAWWRQIETDSYWPYYRCQRILPPDSWQGRFECRGAEMLSLNEFRDYIKEILALDLPAREIVLMRLLLQKYAHPQDRQHWSAQTTAAFERLLKQFDQSDDPALLLRQFWEFTTSDYDTTHYIFRAVVEQAVYTETLWTELKTMLSESPHMRQRDQYYLLTMILWRVREVEELLPVARRYAAELRERLDSVDPQSEEAANLRGNVQHLDHILGRLPVNVLTAEDLAECKKQFREDNNLDYYRWTQAFEVLSQEEPDVVCKWLCKWKNPGKDPWRASQGYELASRFAWKCRDERTQYFTRLLKAKDAWVRVAAAFYLTLEDEEEGLKALSKCARLRGALGTWAALNLAARGDLRAMDQAVKAISDSKYREGMVTPQDAPVHWVQVLLSNSAKYSGLDPSGLMKRTPESIAAWWADNRSKVTLHDPWLAVLTQQRPD